MSSQASSITEKDGSLHRDSSDTKGGVHHSSKASSLVTDQHVSAMEDGVLSDRTNSDTGQPEEEPASPDNLQAMSTLRQSIALLGLLLAVLLMALDGDMIVTAIPTITEEFNSIGDIGWYGSIYFLALVLAQPIFGSVFFHFNIKHGFFVALFIFAVGSIVSAVAKRSYVLIIGRAVAGAGGAGLFSGSLILANIMALEKMKPIYMGMLSSMFGFGSAIGPLIGGALTDSSVTWRFIFWLSLPVGVAVLVTVAFYSLPPSPKRLPDVEKDHISAKLRKLRRLDFVGLALLTISLMCLLLALHWGGAYLPWSDHREIGLLVGFAVGLILFLVKQALLSKNNDQILSLHLLSNRTVAAGAFCDLFFVMAVQMQLYYLPIYFQVLRSNTPFLSGLHLLAYLLAMAVAPVLSGVIVSKLRMFQPTLLVGVALFVIGSGLLFTIDRTTPMRFIIGAQILLGFGAGTQLQSVITGIQSSVVPSDIPLATSLHIFMVSLGSTISISAAQGLFIKYLAQSLASHGIDPGPYVAGSSVAIPSRMSVEIRDLVLAAYEIALNKVFLFALITSCIAFLVALGVRYSRMQTHE